MDYTADPSKLAPDDLAKLQGELAAAGFDPGPADGKYGPRTRAAWQKAVAAHAVANLSDADRAPLSDRSERIIATLATPFQPLVRALIHRASAALGERIEALSGYRSYDEQSTLYQAHLRGGPQAVAPGNSMHNFALGCDLGWFLKDGRYADDLEGKGLPSATLGMVYTRIGTEAEKLGLVWGGRFRHQDMPHVEYHPAWSAGMSEPELMDGLRRRHEAGRDLLA